MLVKRGLHGAKQHENDTKESLTAESGNQRQGSKQGGGRRNQYDQP